MEVLRLEVRLEVFLTLLFFKAVEALLLDIVAVAVTKVLAVRRRRLEERFLDVLCLVLFLVDIKKYKEKKI